MPLPQSYLAELLGQSVSQAGRNWGQKLSTQWQESRMPELAKLQKQANPRDIDDIERLADLLPQLSPQYREKAIEQIRRKIGVESHPLLDYYIQKSGQAPPLGMETWRIGGQPAPEAAKTTLQQAMMGRTPGYPHELGLGQLPAFGGQMGAQARGPMGPMGPRTTQPFMAGSREEEFKRRMARIEPRYPGATQVGRGMIPTGQEGVLPPPEAARQRVRETPGGWEKMLGITKEWTPEQFAFEKEETIALAKAKGILDERGVAAAKTFIDRTQVPNWYEDIPQAMRPRFGLRSENGIVVNDLSEDSLEAASQLNLRSVFSQPKPTLAEIQGMANLDRMRVVVFGSEMLSQQQIRAIERGESTLPSWLIGYIEEPLTSKSVWAADWFSMIKKLLRYFSPQDIAAMLSMAHDRSIREGIISEVGVRSSQAPSSVNDRLARFLGQPTGAVA